MNFEVINFRSFVKNTLQGFFDIKFVDMGMEIKGFTLHHSPGGSKWIGVPSKPYTNKETGETEWQRIVMFETEDHRNNFIRQALKMIQVPRKTQEIPTPPINDDDIPF